MNFKIGFCNFYTHFSPEQLCSRLREYKFDGIELWPNPLRDYGVKRWAKALENEGLACLQLCPYFNFMEGPLKISESRKQLEDFMRVAEGLACKRIRVFTGPPWGEGVVGADQATPEQWDAAIGSLREFCDCADQEDMELCLECHGGSLMENSSSTLRLISSIGRPNLTVNLQLPLLNEDWKVSLEKLGAHTSHLHIHNWTRGMGEGELTYFCEGAFDWKPVFQRLLVDFRRTVCFSIEHADHGQKHDPLETIKRDGPFLRRLLLSITT